MRQTDGNQWRVWLTEGEYDDFDRPELLAEFDSEYAAENYAHEARKQFPNLTVTVRLWE